MRSTSRLENKLRDLPYAIEQALQMMTHARGHLPSPDKFSRICGSFRMSSDVSNVTFKTNGLEVFTDPIVLEETFLGDFEIRLEIEKLAELRDSSAFQIIAVDPHPAATNDNVTHPHVSEEYLCAGMPVSFWCRPWPRDGSAMPSFW